MSINRFLLMVLGLLLGIYSYFTPTPKNKKETGEIPKIELYGFTLYEISYRGIDHRLEGKEGKKFDDYYTITSAKFSDNTPKFLHTIQSDHAYYRDDFLKLGGNLHYLRNDGLAFKTENGTYDTKKKVIETHQPFMITYENSRIDGKNIRYDVDQQSIIANKIQVKYQLH